MEKHSGTYEPKCQICEKRGNTYLFTSGRVVCGNCLSVVADVNSCVLCGKIFNPAVEAQDAPSNYRSHHRVKGGKRVSLCHKCWLEVMDKAREAFLEKG
jgi:hypothetical protein